MCHPDVTITLLSSEYEAGMTGRVNKYVIHVIIAKIDFPGEIVFDLSDVSSYIRMDGSLYGHICRK